MPVAALSEWTPIDRVIKWCVEASETVVGATYGKLSDSYQSGLALVRDQQAHGEAGPGGASNWANASAQLSRLGIPNTAYGPGAAAGPLPRNWPALVSAAVAQGTPVLVGIPHAYNLQDVQTGAHYDAGVFGHAVTIVGLDQLGFLVADPNAPQAQKGQYVHYTAANFAAAGIDSIVVPNSPPGGNGLGTVLGAAAGGVGPALFGPLGGIAAAAEGIAPAALNNPQDVGAALGGASGIGNPNGDLLSQIEAFVSNMIERGVFFVLGFILIVAGLAFFLFGSHGGKPSRAGGIARTAGTAALIAPK